MFDKIIKDNNLLCTDEEFETYLKNIDLTSLEKALSNLERAIIRSQREPTDQEVRDSVIQRFEYSYELS